MEDRGLTIDGQVYPAPTFSSFTLDECVILWEYARVRVEDFFVDEIDEETTRHPGVEKTLLHVAYRRGNPAVPEKKIREIVGRTSMLEAFSTMLGKEDDADPTKGSPSEQPESSPTSSESNGTASGPGSESTSDTPGSHLRAIGE